MQDFIIMKTNEKIDELKNNIALIKANAVLLALKKNKINLKLYSIKTLCEDKTTENVYNYLKRKYYKPLRYLIVLLISTSCLLLLSSFYLYWMFKYQLLIPLTDVQLNILVNYTNLSNPYYIIFYVLFVILSLLLCSSLISWIIYLFKK